MVHRDNRRDLDDLARPAFHRAACAGRDCRCGGAEISPGGQARADTHYREQAGHRPAIRLRYKLREAQESHHLPPNTRVLFVEVRPTDASDFSDVLKVEGVDIGGHHVLRCGSPAIPNAIAALLLFIRDQTLQIPHAYFGWTEGNPIAYLLKFLAFGEGDTAPVTREVLRQAEPDPELRPRIHVG